MKRFSFTATALASLLALTCPLSAFAAQEQQTETEQKYGAIVREGAEPEEAEGYYEVTDVAQIEGSRFFFYAAKERVADMTPIIFVFGDEPYADQDTAKAAMENLGLIDLADSEGGIVILVNPVGEEWGDVDIEVFDAIEDYIFAEDGAIKGTSLYNLQYAIGEGSGATFINNYLSDNCKRIAGVLTVGGEIEDHTALYPLPAYLVSASQEAVDFYLECNDNTAIVPESGRVADVIAQRKSYWETEEEEDKITYVYSPTPVRKVIVSKTEADVLDAEIIADAWQELFRWTTRSDVVAAAGRFRGGYYNDTEFTLQPRPDLEGAGIEITEIDSTLIAEGFKQNVVVYMPKAAQEAVESGSGETFPTIVVFPPADPRLEIEGQGWGQLAIDNNIILVTAGAREPELGDALLDYLLERYPIDESRIYAAGFSGGSHCVMYIAEGIPERFAAITVMDVFDGPHFPTLEAAAPDYEYDIDLPIAIVANGKGTESTNFDGHYNWFDAVEQIYSINEIPPYEEELDYAHYPFWGFPLADLINIEPPTGLAIQKGVSYDEDGIPMFCAITAEMEHARYVEYANAIWDYLKQFSCDTETHAVIYTPAQ